MGRRWRDRKTTGSADGLRVQWLHTNEFAGVYEILGRTNLRIYTLLLDTNSMDAHAK